MRFNYSSESQGEANTENGAVVLQRVEWPTRSSDLFEALVTMLLFHSFNGTTIQKYEK